MAFQPMQLSRRPAPFDHPEWIFELKYDGFRSLATIHNGHCELISRNGHSFNSFDSLRKSLTLPHDGKTVLDGEIVCLDRRGRQKGKMASCMKRHMNGELNMLRIWHQYGMEH